MTVNAAPPPANTAPVGQSDTATTTAGQAVVLAAADLLANDTDADGNALSITGVSGAVNGTVVFDPTTQEITFTPDTDYTGPASFTYSLSDGQGGIAQATVDVTVNAAPPPANTAPIATAEAYSTDEDTPLTISASAGVLANDIDHDNDPLTAALVSGPAHGTLTLNSDGSFTYTPEANYNGPDSFSYQASDGNATTGPVTVNLTVRSVLDPDTLDFAVFDPESDPRALVNAVLASGATLDLVPDSVTFAGAIGQTSIFTGGHEIIGLGSGILLTSGDGTPSLSNTEGGYTRVLDDRDGDPELTAVAQTAFAGAGQTDDANTLSFQFNIADPNATSISFDLVFGSEEFPEFSNSSYVDIAAVFVNGQNVALFNNDPTQPLSVIQRNIDTGAFIDNSNGSIPLEYNGVSVRLQVSAPIQQGINTIKIGIADTGDEALDSGLFVGNFQVTGGTGSGGINIPPVALDDVATTLAGVATTIAVLANDTDSNGSIVSTQLASGPTNGMVEVHADNTITYTPNAGFTGEDSFTYSAIDDGGALSDPATVTVTVEPGAPPALNPGQGQSPGFWKEHGAIFQQETGSALCTKYETIFGVDVIGSKKLPADPSLKQALSAKGGGEAALLRATTAAWANAMSDDVNYVIERSSLQIGVTEAFGLDPAAADYATKLDAALIHVLSVLNKIDIDNDLQLSGPEVINAVRDIYDIVDSNAHNDPTTDLFTWADSDQVAKALDAMNNMPHVEVNAFFSASESGMMLDGSIGNDKLLGGTGDDKLFGCDGNDKLVGGGGKDILDGGAGNDKLLGGTGDDKLFGCDGNDKLVGGGGKDILDGGAGNDKLLGGGGDDTFIFDLGSDKLVGGTGRDTVKFDGAFSDYDVAFGKKVIVTFEGDRDVLIGMERLEFGDDIVFERQGGTWVELG